MPITVQSYSLRAFSNDKLQQLNDNLRKLEKIVTLKHNLLSHKNECLKGEVEQLKNNNADLNRWLTERDDKITEMEAERVMWEQVKDSYERSQTKDKTSDRKNTAV